MEIDNSTITVYVGDVTSEFKQLVLTDYPTATLINDSNCCNLTPGTYYTSVGYWSSFTKDLPRFANVLSQTDNIIYKPPATWSDEKRDGRSKMKYWTEYFLTNFYTRKYVEGFSLPRGPIDKNVIASLADSRKTNEKQIWSVGCSITHGIGINSDQRYGQLVANELKLPVTFLSCPGSSIPWAADQILRSDIRKDDLVIWGLTAVHRFPYVIYDTLIHVTPISDPTLLHRLDHNELVYRAISDIFKVINFCNKIGAKLILASLLDAIIPLYMHDQDSFLMLHGLYGVDIRDRYIDSGDDGLHPGIKTHQWYAEEILKKLSK